MSSDPGGQLLTAQNGISVFWGHNPDIEVSTGGGPLRGGNTLVTGGGSLGMGGIVLVSGGGGEGGPDGGGGRLTGGSSLRGGRSLKWMLTTLIEIRSLVGISDCPDARVAVKATMASSANFMVAWW